MDTAVIIFITEHWEVLKILVLVLVFLSLPITLKISDSNGVDRYERERIIILLCAAIACLPYIFGNHSDMDETEKKKEKALRGFFFFCTHKDIDFNT